jgi:hypothetical protein
MGTLERTLNKFLNEKEADLPYVHWDGQKLLIGSESKHLTRSGVKYNRLLRIVRRTRHETRKTEA